VNVSFGCCGSCKSGTGGRFSINSGIRMPSYNLMDASVIVGRFQVFFESIMPLFRGQLMGVRLRTFSWLRCAMSESISCILRKSSVVPHAS
jgi:hypothetical protein